MGWNPFSKKAKHPMLGLIRNNGYADAVQEQFQAQRDADSSGIMSTREMRKCIKQLQHQSNTFSIPARKLRAQGRQAESVLLEALNNPKFLATKPSSKHFLDSSPAQVAIDLLGDCGSEQSISVVQRFLTHEDCGDAALNVFVKLCRPDQFHIAAEHVAQDPEERKSWMLIGIANRFHKNDGDHELRRLASDWISEHALFDGNRISYEAAEKLAKINPQAAKSRLLSDKALNADSYSRMVAYRTLARNQIWIDADVARSRLQSEQDEKCIAYIVMCSVRNLDEADWQPHFDRLMNQVPKIEDRSDRDSVADALLDTLAIWLGHDSQYDLIGYDIEPDDRSPVQRKLYAIMSLDSEVCNGGFMQFFFNSSCVYWQDVHRMLDEINASQTNELFSQAIRIIGLSQGDKTREAVHSKLERLTEKQEEHLGNLDEQYYDSKSIMKLRVCGYIAKHENALRKSEL